MQMGNDEFDPEDSDTVEAVYRGSQGNTDALKYVFGIGIFLAGAAGLLVSTVYIGAQNFGSMLREAVSEATEDQQDGSNDSNDDDDEYW